MKKLVLSLALAVFLFAGIGLAGGAGVASAHEAPEGKGEPGFRDDFNLDEFRADPTDPTTWPHVHATGNGPRNGFMGLPNGENGPAHFGHQNNPNCGNMHDLWNPIENPSGNPNAPLPPNTR